MPVLLLLQIFKIKLNKISTNLIYIKLEDYFYKEKLTYLIGLLLYKIYIRLN